MRQQRADFLDAGLEEIDDHHRFAVLRADFPAHALEARGAGLQVGDADDVFVGHPQGELPGGFRGKFFVLVLEKLHSIGKQIRISRSLVVRQPFDAQPEDLVEARGALGRGGWLRGCARAGGDVEACGKTAQARFGAAAAALDRLLAGLARQRQRAAAGHGAEQHRVDHGAAVLRELAHVEQRRMSRQLLAGGDDALALEAAVAHLHLFDGRVDAVRGGDQRRALGADIAVLHRAAGLDQLGGDHDVDVAGAGRQRQHRRAAGELRLHGRIDLEVVGGGAGALCDAGNRRALRRETRLRGGIDQPVGHDAAAFAAQGGDQDGDGTVREVHRSRARNFSMALSKNPGFCTTSAR